MGTVSGSVFNIQRYSLHDGPGIRTTVFLKGCPLQCAWCHNPESQSSLPELMYWESRCLGCGACASACPQGAIQMEGSVPVLDRSKCTGCGTCVDKCPSGARNVVGKTATPEEIVREVLKDRAFFDESGGGVTFSGGEPLYQPAFLEKMLLLCRDEGLSTILDTSGFVQWSVFERIIPLVDLVLYDVKLMDNTAHIAYTGVPNTLILDNLRRLQASGVCVMARVPLIPKVNDAAENIQATGEFLSAAHLTEVAVLPYHDTGMDKYRRLGRDYSISGIVPPSAERIDEVVKELRRFGLAVKVGG